MLHFEVVFLERCQLGIERKIGGNTHEDGWTSNERDNHFNRWVERRLALQVLARDVCESINRAMCQA
jgi:hypothetical protein